MNYYIYLDDIRKDDSFFKKHFNRNEWFPIVVRNYEDAVWAIDEIEYGKIFLDLDHDLGLDGDEELNGYDFCKHVIHNKIPPYKFHIHSMNSVGANNIRQLLSHYGWEEV